MYTEEFHIIIQPLNNITFTEVHKSVMRSQKTTVVTQNISFLCIVFLRTRRPCVCCSERGEGRRKSITALHACMPY